VVSVRGIIINLRGKNELIYAWGLGTSSNNEHEAYALLKYHGFRFLNSI